jgi:hypothetical protein
MKSGIVLLALCAFVSAVGFEAHAASLPDGCGSDKVQFDVNTTHTAPPTLTPEPGKALVVFIETSNEGGATWPAISTRFAMDGAWVGANKDNSYFTVSVMPGDHLVCSGRQGWGAGDWADSSPLFAEAGKIYFFESKVYLVRNESDKGRAFHFKQITENQGRSRVNASKLASWTPK